MKKLLIGQVYRRKGFTFKVNFIDRNSVYVRKVKNGNADYVRVTLKTWQREMAGAKPLGR